MSPNDPHPGWEWCTSEGSELHTLLKGLHTPFRDKLRWLEEAENLVIRMRPKNQQDSKPSRSGPSWPPLPPAG